MWVLTRNDFKEFRKFLKKHGIYHKFIKCFEEQKYDAKYHHPKEEYFKHNFIEEINHSKETHYFKYKCLMLGFNSFTWVYKDEVPLDFTRYWCTFICVKWGFYCIKHNLKICDSSEFSRLLEYWSSNKWIDISMLSFEERILLNSFLNRF